MNNTGWTSPRLALVAVLGAVNGAVTTPFGYIWVVLNNTFGILGAAAFQPFQIFAYLAAWLVPIRGVFLLGGTISGFANFLTGDPNGITVVYWGVAGGLAGEIALAIFRGRPEKRSLIVIVAGLLYIPATNVVTYFIYGWTVDAMFVLGIFVALAAITIESSIPAIYLGKWVLRAKLLRTAPIPLTASDKVIS